MTDGEWYRTREFTRLFVRSVIGGQNLGTCGGHPFALCVEREIAVFEKGIGN